jgi:aldehyde:ferredoxin oxidoreductase
MISLLNQMAYKTGVGEVLAEGCERAASRLKGPEYSMSVKGITIQNTDPRVENVWGLLNATENFGGATHIWVYASLVGSMAQAVVSVDVSPSDGPDLVAEKTVNRQNLVAVLDSLQVCAFSSYALSLDDYSRALSSVTGWEVSGEELLEAGARIFTLERLINQKLGFTKSHDTLPRRFLEEPVPTGINKGKICDLGPLLRSYYEARGWGGGVAREWSGLNELIDDICW